MSHMTRLEHMPVPGPQLREALEMVQRAFSASAFAADHDVVIRSNAIHTMEAQTINRVLPRGGTLLDIGTGYGIMPELFHRLGARVISVDHPTTGGTRALQRLMDLGIEGHYAEVGGAAPLPVPDNSVDVVFAGNVIEHLPHSPRPFLAAIRRLLKPGGRLVVDTINAVDLRRRIKFLIGVSNWPPLEQLYPLEFHHEHHKEYTLAELGRAVTLAGFEMEEAVAFEAFFRQPLRGSPLRVLRRSARLMTGTQRRSLFAERFQPLNPAEYLRLACLGAVGLFPNMRSDILVVGRKPHAH